MIQRVRDWLKKWFPPHDIGWWTVTIILAVIGIVIAIGVGALWKSFRDGVSDLLGYLGDFLTSDVEVWLLLLFVAALVGAGAVAAFLLRRQIPAQWLIPTVADTSQGPREKPSLLDNCPTEIDYLGVLWLIDTQNNGVKPTRFKVGKPMCPKDRTTLGYIIYIKDGLGKGKDTEALFTLPETWEKLHIDIMYFHCFKDGSKYDLRDKRYSMDDVLEIVEGQAWGKYRTALADAENQM